MPPRIESTVSPPIPGAGRTLSMAMPAPQLFAVGTNQMGVQYLNRQGTFTWDQGTSTGFGIPPAGTGWTLYRGRIAFLQKGNGTSGGFYTTGSQFSVTFPQTRTAADFTDDNRCWRMTLIAAFDTSGLGSGDIGLEVGAGLNYDVIASTSPGINLAPTSANQISLRVRKNGGGALTINQVVADGIDTADWHMYELRFIGATKQTDAVMKVFVDGIPRTSFNWGAGTLLPDWGNGASAGYAVGCGNRGATGTYTAMLGLNIASAQNEQALL